MGTLRDELRGKLFSSKPKSKVISFNGVDIEVRQPSVKSVILSDAEDKRAAIVRMIIDNCFVPGTEEKVFEPEDYDVLIEMPFGGDWMTLSQTMNDLTDIGKVMEQQTKN